MILTDLSTNYNYTIKNLWETISFHKHFKSTLATFLTKNASKDLWNVAKNSISLYMKCSNHTQAELKIRHMQNTTSEIVSY